MFSTNHTNVWAASEHHEATKQNAKLVLQTNRGEVFGDPYFGLLLKQYMFDQNSYILRDVLIDMIYKQLALFIPQIKVERKDISIVQDQQKGVLICNFSGTNQIDYTLNSYELVLFRDVD
jgi:phage baseplate assembly protein W